MLGNLEPDENVMNDELIASRKSAAVMKALHDKIKDTIAELGWDCYDNVAVEIGGTSVYDKDAFIVIKNLDRNPTVPSQPFAEGEFKPAHPHTK